MKIENVKSHENFGALKIKLGEVSDVSGKASSFVKYLSQNGDAISKSSDIEGKNIELILNENGAFVKIFKGKSSNPVESLRTSYRDCFKNLSHLFDNHSIKYPTLGDNAIRVSRYDKGNFMPRYLLDGLLETFK